MKEIKLTNIHLENYKNLKNVDSKLFNRTEVSGRNAVGKSTVADAIFDILTGKMADGTEPSAIRPHNEDGKDIDKIDIVREITLDVDGTEKVIRKITKQKWVKPRGQAEEVFKGNDTSYEIDGFPAKQKDFAELMNGIAPSDVLLMSCNARPFLNMLAKSTADGRKTLEKMAGFSIENFIEAHPEFSDVAELTRGHSVEDTLKKLRKQLTDTKKNRDKKNTELAYEIDRKIEAIEPSELELVKKEYVDKIDEIEESMNQLDSAMDNADAIRQDIMNLRFELSEIQQNANADIDKQRANLNDEILHLEANKNRLKSMVVAKSILKKDKAMDIGRAETLKKKLAGEWKKVNAEAFDASSGVCPTCGQEMPGWDAHEATEAFENSKKQRVAKIVADGNTAKDMIAEIKEEIAVIDGEIEKLNAQLVEAEAIISEKNAELGKIPSRVSLEGNERYEEIKNEIMKLEGQLERFSDIASERKALSRNREECKHELYDIDMKIKMFYRLNEDKETRVETLNAELADIVQTMAKIEMQLDMIMSFSIEKNKALAEIINKNFNHFHFEFLEFTIDGNPVETCKMVSNGTDYRNLNYSDKILCEIDLCRGFQEMNGLNLPLILDNSESINAERIPQMDRQMIILKVSDSKELTIKEA